MACIMPAFKPATTTQRSPPPARSRARLAASPRVKKTRSISWM
ncbi:MAG: hypothetical protein U1G05_10335 [Kiritimatiellia bacterium]